MSEARQRGSIPPLPVRHGVGPSKVYLPEGPWLTLMEFLTERFPHVTADILHARLVRGDIVDDAGTPQRADMSYLAGRWLWYYREVPEEARVPFDQPILFRDDALIAVDKPHFLASTPGGRYLQETALIRLKQTLDMPWLTPLHRLDRETAGVLLFCAQPRNRGAYQSLFQSRQVYKEYEAIAPCTPGLELPKVYCSRLMQRPGHFTMHEVEGLSNSETRIELVERWGALGRFRLIPLTGRKHQLRVHMSALGSPIVNDAFYPTLQPYSDDDDFSRPLQLLAKAIEFTDPFTGERRRFESRRHLDFEAAAVTP